jgi:hypothetical protein
MDPMTGIYSYDDPHTDSTSAESQRVIDETLGALPAADGRTMIATSCAQPYRLGPAS